MIPVAPLPDEEEIFHTAFLMACLAPTEEKAKGYLQIAETFAEKLSEKEIKACKKLAWLFDNPSTTKP